MMYMGDGLLLESCTKDKKLTRIISLEERFGSPLNDLSWGEKVDVSCHLFWGTYLGE